MKRKRKRLALMPRLGAPQNLRPAGAHEAKTTYNRKQQKAALRRYDEDGFFVALFFRALRARPSTGLGALRQAQDSTGSR